jgi:hypothetical protein
MGDKKHKRKRSLQDDMVDLSKMAVVKEHFGYLKNELDGFRETYDDMESIMTHIQSLEAILQDVKKPVRISVITFIQLISLFQRMSFSTFSKKEAKNLGISIRYLIFKEDAIDQLVTSTANENQSALDLVMRLRDIYNHINMDVSF